MDILVTWILIVFLKETVAFQLFTSKSTDEPDHIVANNQEPFSIECTGGSEDDFHPEWYFTRDTWIRDKMDESFIQKGYDTESQGYFFTNLTIDDVRLDDYGFYECISDGGQGRVLKSFYLYINSDVKLLLPLDKSQTIISAIAGKSVQIPCHLLNPSDQGSSIKLVSLSNGRELPNVVQRSPESGFEIFNARLPEHNGEIQCQASNVEKGLIDSLDFTLRLIPATNGNGNPDDNNIVSPPTDCKRCYKVQQPTIIVDNKHDIHAGDSVTIKCRLVIPKAIEDQVTLKWLETTLDDSTDDLNQVDMINGYVEMTLIKYISSIQIGGPFMCQATQDENGMTTEMRTSDIATFNLVQFANDDHAIEWHKDTFNEDIYVEEGQPAKWVIGFTIHRKDRQILTNVTTFDFTRIDGGGVSLFQKEMKKVDHGQNRFILTLSLEHVDITDMGQYQLRIYDDEDGTVFEPTLAMLLHVTGKPRVSFQGQHPQGYYHPGEKVDVDCHVLSYPMNETRIEVTFHNCTECNAASSSSDESFVKKSQVGGAKSDSLSIITTALPVNNGYSKAVNIQASVESQSGFLICEACRNKFDCSKSSIPIIVTDLPTDNGTFLQTSTKSIVEGDKLEIICAASKFTYDNVTWGHEKLGDLQQSDPNIRIAYWETDFSIGTNLSIEESSSAQHSGTFYCNALSRKNFLAEDTRLQGTVEIRPLTPPKIFHDSSHNSTIFVAVGSNFTLNCGYRVKGDPAPLIVWSKEDQDFINDYVVGPDEEGTYYKYVSELKDGNKTLHFTADPLSKLELPKGSVGISEKGDQKESLAFEGKYFCTASNRGGMQTIYTQVKAKTGNEGDIARSVKWAGLSIGAIVTFFCAVFLILYCYHKQKLKKEKSKYKKILATFKMGDPKGLEALRKKILLHNGQENSFDGEECTNLISADMAEFQKAKNAQMLPYDEDKWEVAFDKLRLQETLGEGNFGKVVKAKLLVNGDNRKMTVAVKTLHSNPERIAVENLMSELKIMIHLGSHNNIVNVLGACTNELPRQELYVIVEYCEHGDIADVLRKHKQAFRRKTLQMLRNRRTTSTSSSLLNESILSEENQEEEELPDQHATPAAVKRMDVLMEVEAVHYRPMNRKRTDTIRENISLTMSKLISWSEQIANGMDYLSSKNVVHGDLACRNILLARNNIVKISDFGLSKYVEYKNYYKNERVKPLPVKWLSLETLNDGVYTCESDIWSYAVVLYELFSLGDTPYPGIDLNDIHRKVTREGLRLSRPEHALDCIYQVMQKCQNDDPELRPTFAQLTKTFQNIASDFRQGNLNPMLLEPRSAFANSLYFTTASETSSTSLTLPTTPNQGADGYLLPSPTVSTFKPPSERRSYLELLLEEK